MTYLDSSTLGRTSKSPSAWVPLIVFAYVELSCSTISCPLITFTSFSYSVMLFSLNSIWWLMFGLCTVKCVAPIIIVLCCCLLAAPCTPCLTVDGLSLSTMLPPPYVRLLMSIVLFFLHCTSPSNDQDQRGTTGMACIFIGLTSNFSGHDNLVFVFVPNLGDTYWSFLFSLADPISEPLLRGQRWGVLHFRLSYEFLENKTRCIHNIGHGVHNLYSLIPSVQSL